MKNYNFSYSHMLKRYVFLILCLSGFIYTLNAQVLLNEIQITNLSTLSDEDGDFEDWFELYNAGNQTVNLSGYKASDNPENLGKWTFPAINLSPGQRKVIFASGKNRLGALATIDHFEVPVYPSNTWKYLVPTSEPNNAWRNVGFNDAAWNSGPGGFGFGDNDDGTTIPWPATSVFSRTTFTLSDPSAVQFMVLNADYDDAFVCYLNGVEIARANIGTPGTPPAFNAFASGQHEALGYQGQTVDDFFIPYSVFQPLLLQGQNVLAVQVHNVDANSSDLTGNMRLAIGVSTPVVQTTLAPGWMQYPMPETHTNFGLTTGETLILTDAAGNIIDSIQVPSMETDHVLRRNTDGNPAWCIGTNGTPETPNTGTCFNGYEAQPIFSIQSGLYPGAVYVELSSPNPQAQIRVTFDGSIPTANSMLYTAPFSVGGTAVVSARAFSNTALPSPVKKNTYLINETDIGIPVISLSTDPSNLWDPITGIHVMGPNGNTSGYPFFNANFWQNWEREGYVEYFDANHQKQMEGPVGIKIHGGWSRAREQKSFRIQAKGKYGMETMDYPLIADKPHITSYKGINLRNGGNDYDNYRFHDALMERAVNKTHADYMGYAPAVVFLNGEYWGFMEIRENLDQHYVSNNHDISDNDVTVISTNYLGFNVISGSDSSFYPMVNYITQNNPTAPNYLNNVRNYLDLENYVDYIITQTYWCNGDWSNGIQNNTKLWHDDRPGGKWRFMLMDLDFGMGLAGNSPNDDYITIAGDENHYTDQIFAALKQNPEFRRYFINRYADLINTAFLFPNVNAKAQAMRSEILDIFNRHRIRWNTNSDALNGALNSRLNWAQQRVQGARNVIQNHFNLSGQVTLTLNVQPAGAGRIHISTIEPSENEYPWTGVYFRGVPVKITAVENPGYTFVNWQSNALIPGGSTQRELELTFNGNLPITAIFEGQAAENPLSVTELMFNPDSQNPSGDWIEIRNNLEVPLNLSGWKIRDDNPLHEFKFPLNTLLQPNEYYVIASDVNEFQAAYPQVNNVMGPLNFSFSNRTDEVNMYRHNGTPYIQFSYSDSDQPDLRCSDGCGHSRGHLGTSTDYSSSQWFLECEGGSPGEPFVPCEYDILISEINYDSPGSSNANDWFEVKNNTNAMVDLSGWKIRDRADNLFEIPQGTQLANNGYLVFARSLIDFSAVHATVQNVVGPTNVPLSNISDAIKIYEPNDRLHISMRYFNTTPWPTEAAGLGKTLELNPGAAHPCFASSWFSGCDGGSPGTAFEADCGETVSVNPINYQSGNVVVYPNPSHGNVNITFTEGYLKRYTLMDLRGIIIKEANMNPISEYTLTLSDLPDGLYLLKTVDEKGVSTLHRVVLSKP